MRTFLLLTLAAGLLAGCAGQKLETISITTGPGTWVIDFYPSGRAHAQYGSSPEDRACVPEGTVDFPALLRKIKDTPRKEQIAPEDIWQVVIGYEGPANSTAFALTDAGFIEDILRKLEPKWSSDQSGIRFDQLKAQHPILHTFNFIITKNQAREDILLIEPENEDIYIGTVGRVFYPADKFWLPEDTGIDTTKWPEGEWGASGGDLARAWFTSEITLYSDGSAEYEELLCHVVDRENGDSATVGVRCSLEGRWQRGKNMTGILTLFPKNP